VVLEEASPSVRLFYLSVQISSFSQRKRFCQSPNACAGEPLQLGLFEEFGPALQTGLKAIHEGLFTAREFFQTVGIDFGEALSFLGEDFKGFVLNARQIGHESGQLGFPSIHGRVPLLIVQWKSGSSRHGLSLS
jgi:hypothetical protein